jgi:hypothetical protein
MLSLVVFIVFVSFVVVAVVVGVFCLLFADDVVFLLMLLFVAC